MVITYLLYELGQVTIFPIFKQYYISIIQRIKHARVTVLVY